MVATWFSYLQQCSARCANGLLAGIAFALAVPLNAGATDRPSAWIDRGDSVSTQGQSGLQWSREDNGRDIDWAGAKSFCAAKGVGWRLPSLDELAALAAQSARNHDSTACGGASCQAPPQFR